ncbi:MAG: hypothetical protein FJX25_15840 [Alphaproteobacteria bacterium]|nr:hypothetical protein [Alphaproteobacteria bacterium]
MTINPIQTLKMGGTVAALATLLATAAVAQTATTDTPAVTANPQVTTMEGVQFPVLDSFATDQDVIDSLSAQGYENITVTREGETMRVTAERGGLPTEMMFSAADGSLQMVDGVEPVDTTGTAPAGVAPGSTTNPGSVGGNDPA